MGQALYRMLYFQGFFNSFMGQPFFNVILVWERQIVMGQAFLQNVILSRVCNSFMGQPFLKCHTCMGIG